jgi:FAD/FMN-containing dehydrogenase
VQDSAFSHRNVDFDFCVDVFWQSENEQATMIAWMDRLMAIVAPYSNGHVYQNYPDPRLANWPWAYFGDAYPQLQQVKAKYDPNNFFSYQQSIVLP